MEMEPNSRDRQAGGAAAPQDPQPPTGMAVVREKWRDALTPGFQVEFDPEEAEQVGAFVEDALSEEEALDSSNDLSDAQA